jgi:hypothetical protein
MMTKSNAAASLVMLGFLAAPLCAGDETKRIWKFEEETNGQIAKGFVGEVGTWSVVNSDQGKALAQSAKNANSVFNITLAADTNAKDVDLSVRMKAVAGETDQGGGLVLNQA